VRARCVQPMSTSHVRKLDAKRWIKLRWKCNVEVKVKCAMWNEQIDGLTTNHNPDPLPKQKHMRVLDVKEIESSSKIDLRDVSWWMSIKNTCKLGASMIIRFSKQGCISLTTTWRPSCVTHKYDWSKWAPPQCENILLQNGSIENTKLGA
jgi:hypothetical protein